MRIKFNRLDRSYLKYKEAYDKKALEILGSGWYTLGNEVKAFEKAFSEFVGINYCVGVNSGLDALTLAVRALNIGPGDEVIVPANTFIATVLGITENGAIPVFVEPDEFYNIDADRIEAKITERTKAILVVHLYGQPANMLKIKMIADQYQLYLIEDCAQSHGAKVNGVMTGNFGDLGCFSFYPTKGIGAFGDAGAIVCKDSQLKERLEMLRNYGSRTKYVHEVKGFNSRLDEIQAGLLSIRLSHYQGMLKERNELVERYLKGIYNDKVKLPKIRAQVESVWHLFVLEVENRDLFQQELASQGIETQIHYPIPPHLQTAYAELGHELGDFPVTESLAEHVISLPLYEGMLPDEIDHIIQVINSYTG